MCVRLETYESKETQDHIRKLLDGSMQNTAFTIYAPNGKTQLTGSGRAPEHVFTSTKGRGNFGGASNDVVIQGMEKIAAKYEPKGENGDAVLQDFDSFKQSLNIASSDQRVLVFTVSPKSKLPAVQKTLRSVADDPEIIGRYHFDSAGAEDVKWHEQIKGESQKTGIFAIHSGEFGQKGTILEELPLDVSAADLKKALLAANEKYADAEERKNYGDHVHEGRKRGINFENNIEAGEDRDGDGKIDKRGERKERRGRRMRPSEGDDEQRPRRRGPKGRGEGKPPRGGHDGPPPGDDERPPRRDGPSSGGMDYLDF